MLDSFRWDHFGAFGNSKAPTPNLDKFAAESTFFTHSYPEGLPTVPVRTSLLSPGASPIPSVAGKCSIPRTTLCCSPNSSARHCNSNFHRRPRLLLEPPPVACHQQTPGPRIAACPISRHQRRSVSTANSEVS